MSPLAARLADRALAARAATLCARLTPHLPAAGRVLDVGAGTGHNAAHLRARARLGVVEVDVASLMPAGRAPILFDGVRLPFEDDAFDAALVLFVLHYARDPEALLADALRVARRVLVLQSTYAGRRAWPTALAGAALAARDAAQGRLALALSNYAGYTRAPLAPLAPARFYTRATLHALVRRAGAHVVALDPGRPSALGLRRELHVLERAP